MSDENSGSNDAKILAALSDLKVGQHSITTKLGRMESILYGREEDDKPGLGERVRRIEDTLKDMSHDTHELKALEKKVAQMEQRQAATSKLLWIIGGATITALARIVFSLF